MSLFTPTKTSPKCAIIKAQAVISKYVDLTGFLKPVRSGGECFIIIPNDPGSPRGASPKNSVNLSALLCVALWARSLDCTQHNKSVILSVAKGSRCLDFAQHDGLRDISTALDMTVNVIPDAIEESVYKEPQVGVIGGGKLEHRYFQKTLCISVPPLCGSVG